LGPEKAEEFRVKIKKAIEKHKQTKTNNITSQEQEAIQQLKANKSIVIRKADKGNVTVIMKKEEYFNKLKKLVDSSEYEILKSNPTSCLERKVNEALKLKEIKKYTRLELAPRYCKAPHIYGLPKIHKADLPLRPIVSSIGSPSHDLAKYLIKIF
jgi:hypothetical protein